MKRILIIISTVIVSLFAGLKSSVGAMPTEIWCFRGDGQRCSQSELANPKVFRQVLVLPTGFTENDEQLYYNEYWRLVNSMASSPRTNYSSEFRSQLLYIGVWLPGGAMGTPESNFAASVPVNPFRGKALTLDQTQVVEMVDLVKRELLSALVPMAVMVVFNDLEDGVTANASPPSFFGKSYGLARITREHLNDTYTASHELAHAGLNLSDEYIERGFESVSVKTLDYLTPLAILKSDLSNLGQALANFFGVYDYHISEVIAGNGTDNIDVTKYTSRVSTAGYTPNEYEHEGGMFFGKGTYHDRGKNLMGSNRPGMPDDDGFAYNHSQSQRGVIAHAFNPAQSAVRPNDRIRNAGPVNGWPLHMGGTTRVLLFDGDKNHHYHPTKSYTVQVGWHERHWKTCWAWIIPYPCSEQKWVTAEKTVLPQKHKLSLKSTGLFGIVTVLQDIACHLGINSLPMGGKNVNICSMPVDQLARTFLPSIEFSMPYQDVEIPASQWMTKYYWRFRSDNGGYKSGYTSWSSFFRSF